MNVNEDYALKIYNLLSENNIFFEYDTKTDCVSLVFDNNFIAKNARLDFEELGASIDDENRALFENFKDVAIDSCSKEQAIINIYINGKKKCYLFETFARNEIHDNIFGQLKLISSVDVKSFKLDDLKKVDPLTGLPNRTSMIKHIEDLIKTKSFFILAMIDLDYFKEINDTYGHIVGDSVLEQVADNLKALVAPVGGEVGRVGGDEFLIAYPIDHMALNIDIKNTCQLIRDTLTNSKNSKINIRAISCTIGACAYPFDGLDFNTLYSKLDKALYRGKAKGRSCYIIYKDAMHQSVDTSLPLTKNVNEMMTADFSVFVSNILNTLLDMPTRDKAISKMQTIANYLRVNRISIFKHDGEKVVNEFTWSELKKEVPVIEIPKFYDFFMMFDENELVVNDIYDFNRSPGADNIKVPYDGGSFVMVPVGVNRSTDYFFAVELVGSRRVWHKYEISTLKVLAKIIVSFYLR